jgi:hypothetical protein
VQGFGYAPWRAERDVDPSTPGARIAVGKRKRKRCVG